VLTALGQVLCISHLRKKGGMAAMILRERGAAAEALGKFGDAAVLGELEEVMAERSGGSTWWQDLLSGERFLYDTVKDAMERIHSRIEPGRSTGPRP